MSCIVFNIFKDITINSNSGDIETIKEFNDTSLMYVSINKDYFTTLDRNIEDNNYVVDNVRYIVLVT